MPAWPLLIASEFNCCLDEITRRRKYFSSPTMNGVSDLLRSPFARGHLGPRGPMMLLRGRVMHEKTILSQFCNNAEMRNSLACILRVPARRFIWRLSSVAELLIEERNPTYPIFTPLRKPQICAVSPMTRLVIISSARR